MVSGCSFGSIEFAGVNKLDVTMFTKVSVNGCNQTKNAQLNQYPSEYLLISKRPIMARMSILEKETTCHD